MKSIIVLSLFLSLPALARTNPTLEYDGRSLYNPEVATEFKSEVLRLIEESAGYSERIRFADKLCFNGESANAIGNMHRRMKFGEQKLRLINLGEYDMAGKVVELELEPYDVEGSIRIQFRVCSEELVCQVNNLNDAKLCMETMAYRMDPDGEDLHTVGASASKKSRDAFKRITKQTVSSGYVGVAEVHYDEDNLYYMHVERGANVTPTVALSTSNVDLPTVDLSGLEGFDGYEPGEDLYDLPDGVLEKLEALFGLYINSIKGDFHL